MNRSGNIGASKNMDSVFADFTEEDVFQDLMFDEDDQLVEIVEGYTEDGNTVFEEDEEIFKIAHQIEDDNKTPEEVKKDTEDLLGPDNDSDQKISGIENVKDEKLDNSQTYDELKKNGESEADKELGLEKLDDEYNSTADASVKEEYEYDKEDEAEGSDTKFGNKELDNSAMPADNIKPTDDENYNSTNDASVKEEYEYDKPDEAEGSDTKFGKEIDNSEPKPEELAPNGDENYNSTADASIKDEPFDESFIKWVHESEDGEKCDCGKDDCPICGKKSELAPTASPIEDKVNDERHEESSGETITVGDGEGITPGNVDDNSLPIEDSTPEGSPEADNGDITDDSDKRTDKPAEAEAPVEKSSEDKESDKLDEAFEKWLHEEDLELPILDPNETITPDDIEKAEEDLEKSAPESDASIKEEFENFLKEEEDTTASAANDLAAMSSEDESNDSDEVGDPTIDEAKLEEAFEAWLHEEDEAEVPTKSDVEAAAETEVEDTESELDDDLAAVADDDVEGEPEGLEYDPTDEELIDLAGGEEIDESVIFEGADPERMDLARKISEALKNTLVEITDLEAKDFNIKFRSLNMLGTGKGKGNRAFLRGESNEIFFGIVPGFRMTDLITDGQSTRQAKAFEVAKQTIKTKNNVYVNAIKKATGKSVTIDTEKQKTLGVETVLIKITLK